MTDNPREETMSIAHPHEFFIGGAWIKPTTSKTFDLVSPVTEEVFMTVAAAAEADMDLAVVAAREAFDNGPWPRFTPEERAGYLRRLAAALTLRERDLAHAWTRQIGNPFHMSLAYTGPSIAMLTATADLVDKVKWTQELPTMFPGSKGMLVAEPVGVVAAIAPWNGPLFLILPKVAPALLAGCTVIMKPAPSTPLEALIIAECAESVDFPPGVINVLTADNDVSNHLVLNHGVDKVAFTGSTAAGRKIASEMGSRIGRYTLELGGKSAAIILDDYDVASAAQQLAYTLTNVTGQFCTNLTRILVPRAKIPAFVEAMTDTMKSIKIGDPYDAATMVGPLVNRQQFERVKGYVAKGVAEGLELATGGRPPADHPRGFFFEPTLFTNVANSATLAQEEIFGPVGCVIAYDTVDQAIAIANDSIYGLAGSVFTHDNKEAYRIARAIRTGTFSQNGLKFDFSIGFGGFKQSGIGREGGLEGIKPYLEMKTLILDAEAAAA